ncbi:CngA, partial [Symbiodinium sp. CCMP2456]
EGTWLCEIALWTQWWHRGQLSAQGAALYTYVDVAKFMRLVIETGGYSYMYLRTVGILMAAVMENMMNDDEENDLSINEERQEQICERAFHFQQLARVSLAAVMRGAHDNDEES